MANEEFENWLDVATRSLKGRSRAMARVYLRGDPEEVARLDAILEEERKQERLQERKDMYARIDAKATEGMTPEQISYYFITEYGTQAEKEAMYAEIKQEREAEYIQERREMFARIDAKATEGMSPMAREAYFIEQYGSTEEKREFAERCAKARSKEQLEERLAVCQDIDDITTRSMTPESRRAYYIYTYGSKEEVAEYERRCAEERQREHLEERREIEDYQRKAEDRDNAISEIKQPLNEFIEGDIPPESEVLVGVLKNIMEMEKRWSFRDDDKTLVIRDFLNKALTKTLSTIEQTNGINTPEADDKLAGSISKYLKIVRAAQDAGYPYLDMRNELTYRLESDSDKDLGFGKIRECLHGRRKEGHNIEIELPRDYSERYPQNYAGAMEILTAMQHSIEGSYDQAKVEWRLLGYKSPDELRNSLVDKSVEERTAEAKSGRRGATEWKKNDDAAKRHGLSGVKLPYGMAEKIESLNASTITPEQVASATVNAGVTLSDVDRATHEIGEYVNRDAEHNIDEQGERNN